MSTIRTTADRTASPTLSIRWRRALAAIASALLTVGPASAADTEHPARAGVGIVDTILRAFTAPHSRPLPLDARRAPPASPRPHAPTAQRRTVHAARFAARSFVDPAATHVALTAVKIFLYAPPAFAPENLLAYTLAARIAQRPTHRAFGVPFSAATVARHVHVRLVAIAISPPSFPAASSLPTIDPIPVLPLPTLAPRFARDPDADGP